MKHNCLKHLFTALLLLYAMVVSAHEQKVDTTANKMAKSVEFITSIDQPDFNVNGIYYNINGSSATVEVSSTYHFTGAGWEPSPSYSGDVVIPENVTYDGEIFKVIGIRGFAFYGCKNLTSVKIPVSIETVGVEAFRGCTGLTAVYIDDLAAWCNIGFATEADLPSWASPEMSSNPLSYSNKLYLKQAGQYSLLTRLYIPFGVTKINGVAFAGSDIESVTIPNSVKVIGKGAFMECTNLRSVNLSNSVTSIEWYAFGGCTGLEEIHCLSSEPATIEEDAFTDYSATLYVPGGAENAYKNDFYWKKFANIVETVDKGLEFTITSEEDATVAVTGYSGNKSTVAIPSHYTIDGKTYTVTSIGNRAFYDYAGLTSVEISNSVTSIGNQAFLGCTGLTNIEIPNGVTTIGSSAFNGCTGLTSVVIPNSVTSIGGSAFNGCTGLTSVEFNAESCTRMGKQYTSPVFSGCTALSTVTIGEAVKTIPKGAFSGCTGLTSVISYIPTENLFTLDYFCDYEVYPACTLYVPKGAKEKYASTHEWDFFGVIVEINIPGITLNRKTVILTEGETSTLVTIVSIDGVADEDIIWSTSNSAVATVESGLVTAIAPGSATITATVGGYSDSCVVTVADPITSLSELNNNTVYHICQPHHSKGATSWAVETDGNTLKSNVDLGIEMNVDDCSQQFAILCDDCGNTYFLYHVTESKFICKDGSLSETPVDAIKFMEGAFSDTFFAYFDDSHYVNVGGSQQMLINSWSTPDGGNSCLLQPVGEFDPTEALEAIHNFTGIEDVASESKDERAKSGTVYDLQGRKLSEITEPGIYLIDGKKVLVK